MTPKEMADIHAAAFTRQRPWSKAEFKAYLSAPHTHIVTVEAGFGLLRVVAPEAEILTLAVHPKAQRRGLGLCLVTEMIATAETGAATEMFLEVAASNIPALALYHGLGFAETGRRPGYYRYPDGGVDDAILMRRSLSA